MHFCSVKNLSISLSIGANSTGDKLLTAYHCHSADLHVIFTITLRTFPNVPNEYIFSQRCLIDSNAGNSVLVVLKRGFGRIQSPGDFWDISGKCYSQTNSPSPPLRAGMSSVGQSATSHPGRNNPIFLSRSRFH